MYVEAFDFQKLGHVDDVKALTEGVRKTVLSEWESRGDFFHNFNTLDAIAYSPNCAPFSIFPFRARTCVELLIGTKCYVTFLNLSAVGREFEKRGWTIEKDFAALAKEGNKESFLRVRKGPFHCDIPPGDFMRLEVETLRPKTIIDACESKLRQGPNADQGYLLALYEGESKLWNIRFAERGSVNYTRCFPVRAALLIFPHSTQPHRHFHNCFHTWTRVWICFGRGSWL